MNKIEHNVYTAPDPAVVGFLKAMVGYSPGDSNNPKRKDENINIY